MLVVRCSEWPSDDIDCRETGAAEGQSHRSGTREAEAGPHHEEGGDEEDVGGGEAAQERGEGKGQTMSLSNVCDSPIENKCSIKKQRTGIAIFVVDVKMTSVLFSIIWFAYFSWYSYTLSYTIEIVDLLRIFPDDDIVDNIWRCDSWWLYWLIYFYVM